MSLMYSYPCTLPVYLGILINEHSLFITQKKGGIRAFGSV